MGSCRPVRVMVESEGYFVSNLEWPLSNGAMSIANVCLCTLKPDIAAAVLDTNDFTDQKWEGY